MITLPTATHSRARLGTRCRTGTKHDLRVRYRGFGNSWRIKQRQSLFRYAPGKSTRSYTDVGFPAMYETVASLRAGKRSAAERACKAAGVTGGQLLDACELDVVATGDKAFASSDAKLQRAVVHTPGWSKLSGVPGPSPLSPSLGFGAGRVFAAYDDVDSKSIQVASFVPGTGAPSGIAHSTAVSGWSDLSTPILLPNAAGGQQLLFSGTHSTSPSDSLNGLDLSQLQPNRSFGAPTAIEPNGTSASGAVVARDGRTLLWTTSGVLNVDNDSTNPPTHAYPPAGSTFELTSDAKLVYDTTGRLWLAWYGTSGSGSGGGVYLLQLDPETGGAISGAIPQLAPQSGAEANSIAMKVACNSICHIVYEPGSSTTELVSWAPGQAAPVVVADGHAGLDGITAAAAPDGRLWVIYVSADSPGEQVIAKLGNDNGAGGGSTSIPPPPGTHYAVSGAAYSTAEGLVLAVNWLSSGTGRGSALWGTVLAQP